MGLLKKIFATVSEKDFYNFRDRAKAEGMSIDEAFKSIVHAYATGASIECHNNKELKDFSPKHNQGVDYINGRN